MCFALLAIRQHPDYPFILAANRDEFYRRPALPMQLWDDEPGVLGGRDVESTGSWLALNRQDARLVLVTNVRSGQPQAAGRSRGLLVRDMARGSTGLPASLRQLPASDTLYAGYNLVAGHLPDRLYYYSNRDQAGLQALPAGFHGLSNAQLDTPWPKVLRGKAAFVRAVQAGGGFQPETFFSLLHDMTPAPDGQLPDTGVGLERERWLSPIFIHNPEYGYGTRCSTLVWMDKAGKVACMERSYQAGECFGDTSLQFYSS